MRPQFLPIGGPPHPIWTSSSHSTSATRSAVIQAKILVGTYRCNAVTSRWSGESAACSLPGCTAAVSDVTHLLSGLCPPLRPKLIIAAVRGLAFLSPHPHLFDIVVKVLHGSSSEWAKFLADPSTNPDLICYKQLNGIKALNPIFRFSRSITWSMHIEYIKWPNKIFALIKISHNPTQ